MISPLPFDSSLFGYQVGKFQCKENWNEKAFLEEAEEFNLVYLMSSKKILFTDSRIKLMDTKLTYSKAITIPKKAPLEVGLYKGGLSETLIGLALESGIYSRFKLDLRLTHYEFEKLYSRWIKLLDRCRWY